MLHVDGSSVHTLTGFKVLVNLRYFKILGNEGAGSLEKEEYLTTFRIIFKFYVFNSSLVPPGPPILHTFSLLTTTHVGFQTLPSNHS